MDSNTYDDIVIGAGPVGENIADPVVQDGLSAAIVERKLVARECSSWACTPRKLGNHQSPEWLVGGGGVVRLGSRTSSMRARVVSSVFSEPSVPMACGRDRFETGVAGNGPDLV